MNRLMTTVAVILAMAFPAFAEKTEVPTTHTIEMWNKDPEDSKRRMVFSDEVITIGAGDTVDFLATDKGHNVEFIDGPDGIDLPKKSKISADVSVTLTEPGVYVYVCTPHATMGMIGVIVVGEVTDEALAAIEDAKVRGKAKKKLAELLSELD